MCGLVAVECGLMVVECGLMVVECGLMAVECGLMAVECGLRLRSVGNGYVKRTECLINGIIIIIIISFFCLYVSFYRSCLSINKLLCLLR